MKNIVLAVMDFALTLVYFFFARSEEKGKFERKAYFACSVIWLLCGMINILAWLA